MTDRTNLPEPMPRGAALALSLRFVIAVAVIGMGIGAVLMLWEGFLEVFGALKATAVAHGESDSVVSDVMEATDKFLFGIVLVIFAFTITFGFLIDLPAETRRRLPRWIAVGGVSELKHVFFEVILIYLAVDFATDSVAAEAHREWTELVKPASILLLAGAMRLLVGSTHPSHDEHSGR